MARIKQRLLYLSILLTGLGLCLPLYKKIYQAYTQSSQEHFKAGFEIPAEPENDSQTIEPESQPPQELANNAEVIFISGYEPNKELNSGKVKVNIDRPDQNVLLVLSSYDAVNWEVEATSATNITGVLVGSYHPSTVANIDSNKVFPVELSNSYELENRNFVEALKQLKRWFGIDRVNAFRGQYSLPSEIKISQLDSPNPAFTLAGYPVQEPSNNFEFTLYNDKFLPVEWTLKGAKDKSDRSVISQTGITISPDGTEIYELTDDGIKVTDKKTGKQKDFKLPRKFPELSWGTDIAYDSKRDLVSLVSSHVEGYFYRFDVKKRRWLDVRSTNNINIQSLTYDRTSDRYIAWAENYAGNEGDLLFISGTGELLSQESISDRMKGFYRLYDRGNGPSIVPEIVAKGDKLALIARNNDFASKTPSNNSIQAIWHYDLMTNVIQLTYKSD